eukprot:5718330-Ditylum_brightwellii.AAC.1
MGSVGSRVKSTLQSSYANRPRCSLLESSWNGEKDRRVSEASEEEAAQQLLAEYDVAVGKRETILCIKGPQQTSVLKGSTYVLKEQF